MYVSSSGLTLKENNSFRLELKRQQERLVLNILKVKVVGSQIKFRLEKIFDFCHMVDVYFILLFQCSQSSNYCCIQPLKKK